MKKLLLIFILLFSIPAFAAEFVPIVHSTEYESAHIITTNRIKALYWITVTWHNNAGTRWLIIYDSVTIPIDGALDTTKVLYCAVVSLPGDGSIGTKSFDWTQHPLQHGSVNSIPPSAAGLVAIISVDPDGCAVKAADGNNNWLTAGFN